MFKDAKMQKRRILIDAKKPIEDFANILVQKTRKKLFCFIYDYHKFERNLGQLEERDIIILENGARYKGQWLVNQDIR